MEGRTPRGGDVVPDLTVIYFALSLLKDLMTFGKALDLDLLD
jgi:hypothetical protein